MQHDAAATSLHRRALTLEWSKFQPRESLNSLRMYSTFHVSVCILYRHTHTHTRMFLLVHACLSWRKVTNGTVTGGQQGYTHTHTHTTLHARGCTLPTAYKGPRVNTMK